MPRKNIREFHGQSIISYAIRTAQESNLFDQIIVSTDDDEIASISESLGVNVPWRRPSELSDDFATTLDVMQDAVLRIEHLIPSNSRVCCIYPTTPLLRSAFLRAGVEKIREGKWDYVISAIKNQSPIERSFTLENSNRLRLNYPQHESTRTQDLPISYQDAGQFYWGNLLSWKSKLPIFSSNTAIVEIPKYSTADIDSEEDWLYAENLYSIFRGSN